MKYAKLSKGMELEDIRTFVEERFKKSFPRIKYVKVVVKEDEGWEGDELIDIIVVFDGAKKLDSKKTVALYREISDWLTESEEERFPMLGFVIKAEAGEMGIAT